MGKRMCCTALPAVAACRTWQSAIFVKLGFMPAALHACSGPFAKLQLRWSLRMPTFLLLQTRTLPSLCTCWVQCKLVA